MSLNLPDDFTVDVVDLHSEFADQSKMIGRRGKTLGKGATSTVRLMIRKGGPSSELYAVKEFRGKQSNEKEEDYEKKVKSEYSIAKSLHHPNIVETFRLCTHHGRWNHVMEYCEEGDLFSFVQKGYLKQNDRLTDRLCLFKQLIQGVHYLHKHGIAHRDIKLENLLITSQSKLKITDFGVSEVFSGIHPGLRAAGGQCGKEMGEVRLCAPGICGSMPYIAPEVVQKAGMFYRSPFLQVTLTFNQAHMILDH
jgi:protein-serine/threonine kinase